MGNIIIIIIISDRWSLKPEGVNVVGMSQFSVSANNSDVLVLLQCLRRYSAPSLAVHAFVSTDQRINKGLWWSYAVSTSISYKHNSVYLAGSPWYKPIPVCGYLKMRDSARAVP